MRWRRAAIERAVTRHATATSAIDGCRAFRAELARRFSRRERSTIYSPTHPRMGTQIVAASSVRHRVTVNCLHCVRLPGWSFIWFFQARSFYDAASVALVACVGVIVDLVRLRVSARALWLSRISERLGVAEVSDKRLVQPRWFFQHFIWSFAESASSAANHRPC